MLVGKMEVLTDQETKNMIWRRGDTMFYKKGVTDPDYCVLYMVIHGGEKHRSVKRYAICESLSKETAEAICD